LAIVTFFFEVNERHAGFTPKFVWLHASLTGDIVVCIPQVP